MEPLTVEAGEELDKLVAEKVIEQNLSPITYKQHRWDEGWPPACLNCYTSVSNYKEGESIPCIREVLPPRYSTSNSAAIELVEYLRFENKIRYEVSIRWILGHRVQVILEPFAHGPQYRAVDATMPLAVCRAALRSVGIETKPTIEDMINH